MTKPPEVDRSPFRIQQPERDRNVLFDYRMRQQHNKQLEIYWAKSLWDKSPRKEDDRVL
jgi:hypothetical protein